MMMPLHLQCCFFIVQRENQIVLIIWLLNLAFNIIIIPPNKVPPFTDSVNNVIILMLGTLQMKVKFYYLIVVYFLYSIYVKNILFSFFPPFGHCKLMKSSYRKKVNECYYKCCWHPLFSGLVLTWTGNELTREQEIFGWLP